MQRWFSKMKYDTKVDAGPLPSEKWISPEIGILRTVPSNLEAQPLKD